MARDMDRPRRLVNGRPAALSALAGLFLLGGCGFFSAPAIQRGTLVTSEQLAEIRPGLQSRSDVQNLLGSPSARSTFDDTSWYYISSVTRIRPIREQSVSNQRVVQIDFDGEGKVTAVRELGESDARPVTMVARETPVPGNERTLLQALFGNIGRVGPNPLGQGAAGVTPAGQSATQGLPR